MSSVPDPYFAEPRLAATYDAFEGERDDLDLYEAVAAEFDARTVLDVGCGTGVFACRLATRGLTVTGLDPAAASVDIARARPAADAVTWIVGTIDDAPADRFDLVTMTGNVAQVFVTDAQWADVLGGCRRALRTGGLMAFETRDPARRAWERWTPDATWATAALPDGDRAETWCVVTRVEPPLVSFRYTTRFASDGAELVSTSTLRFRARAELDASLDAAGFDVVDVRDAPDRPGDEWVYLAWRR